MSGYAIHTIQSAPHESAELLANAEKAFGFVPNLLGVLAESPAATEAYLTLGKIFDRSSFNPTERQVVILAISRYNECAYCMAAHSVIASMHKVPNEVVEAIRDDQPIENPKLEALRIFATAVVDQRGWVSERDVAAFLSAGYGRAHILDVILAASLKTLSNYANHVADTPLDDAFVNRAWRTPEKSAA